MTPLLRSPAFALAVAAALAACGPGRYEVVRVVDGEQIPGRFVSEQAYADYARAAVLEAAGDANGALLSYMAALENDGDSAELWTRLGLLRCRLDRPDATAAFSEAERIDPEYEPLWRARAQCLLHRGKPKEALASALRAVARDPGRIDTSILVATLYARLGRFADAALWLDALAATHSDSVAAQRALLDYARDQHDAPRARMAESAIAVLEPHARETDTRPLEPLISRDELDRKLPTANLDAARSLSLRAHVAAGELALRAAALGRLDLATEQAGWLLTADPTDSDAWVAALVAADLSRDEAAFAEALVKIGDGAAHPSPLGRALFAELLMRRVGPEAARNWLDSSEGAASDDALTRRVAARLDRALSGR